MRHSWTRKKVRDAILGLHRTTGKINSNFAQVYHRTLYQSALRYCGSWEKAVRAAGFDYSSIRARKPFRQWSKKAVIATIKRRKRQRLPLNGEIINREERGLYRAARRHFGSWDKALRQIGLSSRKVFPHRVWTEKKVTDEIRTLYRSDTVPYAYFLIQNGYGRLVSAGCRWFGSWKKAVEAAGLDYNQIRRIRIDYWTKKKVVQEIKRLERLDISLNLKATQKTRSDLVGAAIRRFGSWSQAVDAAGINYRQHCFVWSTKAWLRRLATTETQASQRRTS